jgi:hypothetical protein
VEPSRIPPLQRSDAWLLLALIYAGEPADRERIVRVGDGINHAIFTEEELEGGLTRLLEAGSVVEVAGRFSPSPSVQDWFAQASPPRSRIPKDLERVERFLGVGRAG